MISLSEAGVRFGERWIFRRLDLTLAQGTCLALLGPNGRGKTTLIKAALGSVRLSEGRRQAPPFVGYVPQAGSPGVPYRVLDVVVMGRARQLGVFGSPGAADYRLAREALRRVGLAAFAEHPFDRISGGERQLVLLARALATGASTIVLDEPASALDLANQNRFLSILASLRAEGTYAILFSTHLPQHALHVADETMLMLPAEILRGPTAEVMTEQNLARLYGVAVRRVVVEDNGRMTEAVVPVFGQAHAQS
jgi:iron complex transport system ATP-binding protein